MKSRKADMVWGILWFALAVFVWVYTTPYAEVPSFDPIGAAYFPKFLAILIGICGVGLFLDSYVKYSKERSSGLSRSHSSESQAKGGAESRVEAAADIEEGTRPTEDMKAPKGHVLGGYLRVLYSVIACIIYGYLLDPVGYLVLTPFFIAAVMLIYGERRKKEIAFMSFGFTVVLYAVFALGLKVLLPHGILSFIFE